MVCEPVAGSTVTSAKLRLPTSGYIDPLSSCSRTGAWSLAICAGQRLLAEAQQVGARLLDVDIDRVEALDGGQGVVLPRPDQRAGGVERAADAAGDRGADHGAVEVDLGGTERRGLGLDVGASFACRRNRIVVELARDEVALHQLGIAANLAVGGDGRGAGAGERGAGIGDLRFVGDRIDPIEGLAFADIIALGEQAARG